MTADSIAFLEVFVVFVALWSCVCLLLSYLSGWHRLAEQFRSDGSATEERVWFCQARMRYGVHYGNIVNFGFSGAGVRISVFPLFRVGHPPLEIPWNEVRVYPPVKYLVFFTFTQAALGRAAAIPMTIYSPKAQRIISEMHATTIAGYGQPPYHA